MTSWFETREDALLTMRGTLAEPPTVQNHGPPVHGIRPEIYSQMLRCISPSLRRALTASIK